MSNRNVASTNKAEYLDYSPSVAAAIAGGEPVVALESTIISHGMPYPANVETALAVEAAVRDNGATPATIAVLDGRLKAGLSGDEIERLGKLGQHATKCSRRDLPFVIARKDQGATTVAATMIIAARAGIRTFATGGIGGVHRGVEDTMDISADLQELAQTSVAVVCAGIKSVLDIGRTLEYLETTGVPVIGYQTDVLPAFYCRESEFGVDYRFDDAGGLAAALKAKWELGLRGGAVVAVPVPSEYALDASEVNGVISDAIDAMNARGIRGKNTTPFMLEYVARHTAGRSLAANIGLIKNNAAVAAQIATSLSQADDGAPA